MKILHVVPGLNEPWNGIAGAARDIARSQGADIVDTREFVSSSTFDFSSYDEIWVHSNWWLPTIKACRKVLKAGVPLVRMPHANLDPLRLQSKGWKKKPTWWLVERRLTNRAARVVVTCEAEREWCEQAGVRCPFEILDLKRFYRFEGIRTRVLSGHAEFGKVCVPTPLPAAGRHDCTLPSCDPLHILYLGRRHPLKGVEFLEQAIKELNSAVQPSTSNLQPRFTLRIVSDHTGDELEADWAWTDVLVLPTLSENFGRVVAEALEHGKPVITTDGAPAWEGQKGVTYLKGYRDGTDETRVKLLADALKAFVE